MYNMCLKQKIDLEEDKIIITDCSPRTLNYLLKNHLFSRTNIDKLIVLHTQNKNALIENIEILLDQGAYIDSNNGAPLYNAIKNERLDIVEYLIDRGALIQKKHYECFLTIRREYDNYLEIKELLYHEDYI